MAFPDRLTSTRPALHTSAFTVAFFGGLRVRGFTGLMMIMHKRRSEEFVNVFNSSILY